MVKRVRCTISRANNMNESYEARGTISGGANGEFVHFQEGTEICIKKPHIYCFKDAVVVHDTTYKDPHTLELKNLHTEEPRFIINYKAFYMCDNSCGGDYSKCKAQEISHDSFWEEEDTIEQAMDKVEKKSMKREEFDEDNMIL